jgi:hypothetical protein
MTFALAAPAVRTSVANPWALVPPLGGICDADVSAANRLPMLTLEEEQDVRPPVSSDDNDLEAAGKLVLSHLAPGGIGIAPVPGLRPAPWRPDPGRQCRPDEGRQALRPRTRACAW